MRRPALSVLIDTYNHERYIEQAIVSAIEQDFPASEYEILVVDDGSTDRTPEIVRKFAPRVRLLSKKNGGQASAFNAGIPETRGEIVAFLDGDDWFAPGKISAVMQGLEEHPEIAGVGHGHYEFQEKAQSVKIYSPPSAICASLATAENARNAQSAWRSLLMGALTIRKDLVQRVLPIPEALTFCADTPIQMLALAHGAIILQEPLFYYRRHDTNLYSNAAFSADTKGLHRKLDVHRLALQEGLRVLLEQGVAPESARQLICPALVDDRRMKILLLGGSRMDTLRTEIRSLDLERSNSSPAYHAFKCAILSAAALSVPPRSFYRIRNRRLLSRFWYHFLDVTYTLRHVIGLNRRRATGSGAKAAN